MSKPRIVDPKAIKAFGLTQIYTPRDDPTIDIVFVHGLNGHPHDSWTSKTTGCFWPTDLLPDVLASQRPRILTYGYNANVTAFTDGASRDSVVSHAETLASSLAANRNLRDCSNRPIIFICHSLGGLIVKRALIYSRSLSSEKTEHLRSVYVSTFGILFLGTPHNGSDIAKWGLLLHNICNAVLPKKFMEASPQLVKALRTNNETLQHINSLFVDIMGRFHIYFFHETQSTDMHGTREVIVDEHSAAPYMEGVERAGIEADHSHMCKFDDDNAAGYEVVAEAILRYSRQAPAVITDRWVEEKNARTQEKKAKAREIYDARIDDPPNRSMPELNGNDQTILPPPRGPATEGRNSPVSDLGNSGTLQLSHYSNKDSSLFVAPPGFHPNATFFGMEKELEVLHNRLFKAKARPEKTMAVLISGVPGSGKTHLARQYVFTHRDCYPGGIFWIDAKSRESTYKCFWEIAQKATLVEQKLTVSSEYYETEKYVNAVRLWLQTRRDWLLVFDGVTFDRDDDINKFREVLPWSKQCSIIYTSVDTTLRKKQRLYEPYCLMISRLQVEDACKLLFKDLGITRATPEQISKATRIVEHYECLPLAIHAIGHRLNATGKPIEKYHVKSQVTDKKLAEPFLSIMNDLFRLQQKQALHLINLLSFLGHQVPVGLLSLGRAAMAAENLEIQTSAQAGEDPDLDTTLGTLIHYGLVERISDADLFQQRSSMHRFEGDQTSSDVKTVPELSDSLTESSQEGFFSVYSRESVVDVVKIHSVVQGFCRDELRIKDEENKGTMSKSDPGFFDTWLIVAARFLITSYEGAMERMAHYEDCGLVRDYREYETHASRLLELFPKKAMIDLHPLIVRETRENLRQLMKFISKEIANMSPSSSQHSIRNQKSVFDRSSSSSSSFRDSSADEGPSRRSTFNWSDLGSPRAESPEEISMPPPRFRLELFPPHIFRQDGYESEEGYETDGEATEAIRISPAMSQMSQATEKPTKTPPSSSPPSTTGLSEWQVVNRHSKPWPYKGNQTKRWNRNTRRFRDTKIDTPLVELSSVQGKGSSSRTSAAKTTSSLMLASEAEQALAAVRRSSSSQASIDAPQPKVVSPPADKENMPTYASVATRRMLEVDPTVKRRPSSIPVLQASDAASGLHANGDLQGKPSTESLDSEADYTFTSPLSHDVSGELMTEPLSQSTYSEPEFHMPNYHQRASLHTAPGSRVPSRRASVAHLEVPRNLSASVPSLLPYPPPLLYDENIGVAFSSRRRSSQLASSSMTAADDPGLSSIAHPSAIMPGTLPLPNPNIHPMGSLPERSDPEPMSRNSSGYSNQSWVTEPVRYPPRFSPLPSYQQAAEMFPSPPASMQYQQQMLAGAGSWTTELPLVGSSLQPDPNYPSPPLSSHGQLSSMDERLKYPDPGWNPDIEPARYLHFGRHRVDVRDARHRLHGSTRLLPPHPQQYRLYHPNLSGPLIQHDGQVYASAPRVGVYGNGTRTRSGSSPARPNYAGLGMRF
ncbi:uncharacterized protein N7500_008178 [Penicillium coprophilum]|uniref:uncharacterized protein n=1 Tax=Penicillium coprophilum TaxID=36646 RepID=UPI0023A7670B|nr:uncharacterized protein N7500_008178 [Penicillium coprophilum]KAJ5158527.1 hypothetical protein N7500_008178 [Penicillium coprophilum]